MKESQREVNGGGTPRQSKKEGAAKAQDVAELKDYVGMPMLHTLHTVRENL